MKNDTSNFTCLLKNICFNYTKKWVKFSTACSSFGLTYTQLNVYMWMYLRNRTVLIILVKSSVGIQGRKCLPFMLTLWSPPLPEYIHRHQKNAHVLHTHTHTHHHQCPTHNIPETIFKQLSVNKQTPTYSSDRIDADENYYDSVQLRCCLWSFCHFMSFMRDTNYVYKRNPATIQYLLNTPGQHYYGKLCGELLQAIRISPFQYSPVLAWATGYHCVLKQPFREHTL